MPNSNIDGIVEGSGQHFVMDNTAGSMGQRQKMRPPPRETAAVEPKPKSLQREIRRHGQDCVDNMEMSLWAADAQSFPNRLHYLLVIEMMRCCYGNDFIEGSVRELQIGAIHGLETTKTRGSGMFDICRFNVDPGVVLGKTISEGTQPAPEIEGFAFRNMTKDLLLLVFGSDE